MISVVIPIYNGEKYLSKAIDSVLNQSYQDFEILISDDSIADSCKYIIEKYKDKRIKYFRNAISSKGIFGNLNNAITKAEGEYIQILCQDDVLGKNMLDKHIFLLKKYPNAGMIFSAYEVINSEGIISELPLNLKAISNEYPEYINPSTAINYLLTYGCLPGNLSPVMLKKESLEKVGLFDVDYPYGGDYEYWVRIASKNFGFVYNNIPSLYVRKHVEQASITLGADILIRDVSRIYQSLYAKHTIKKSGWYVRLYLNQLCSQYLKPICKSFIAKRPPKYLNIGYLNKYPLNLAVSFLFLILSVSIKKFLIIKINKKYL